MTLRNFSDGYVSVVAFFKVACYCCNEKLLRYQVKKFACLILLAKLLLLKY